MALDDRAWALYREVAMLPGGETGSCGTVDHEWREIRRYEPTSEDGRLAVVEVVRWPAQFYRVRSGDLEIGTGSGPEIGLVADAIAQAISQGMLSVRFGAAASPEGAVKS